MVMAEPCILDATAGLSRARVKHWVDSGLVFVNGKAARKAGARVEDGDLVMIVREAFPAGGWDKLEPNPIPLEIVYRDDSVLVINKPAGLSVHPGAGNRNSTMVNALLALPDLFERFSDQARKGNFRPGIVHRLDKDTSGLLVVALDALAHQKLSAQFALHSVERAYLALVYSTPRGRRLIDQQDSGTVETSIGRDQRDRTRMAVLERGGRKAITHWRVLQRMACANLLELRLETGRTHQIRVHMSYCGSPLIGDRVYAGIPDLPPSLRRAAEGLGRQALHAFRLGFEHPADGRRLLFESPMPEDMRHTMREFGGQLAGL